MPARDGLALVSVIIPTYNRSQLLRLTVESVLAQAYPNVEIIVADDGSTDDTEAVMAGYAGRVIYVKQEHLATHTGNMGFQAASGEYINFLDHDDLMMPTKIERQVQVLDSRPEIGVVHCGYYTIDKDGNLLEKYCPLPEGNLKELVCGDPIWSGAPLIRRQCLEQVGLFDTELWTSDWEMWLRIAQAGYLFACVQEPLGSHRILSNSMASNIDGMAEGVFATLDKRFADPNLPADMLALKNKAYGGQHFWLSSRYYAAGRWEEGQRHLSEALALEPERLVHTESLFRELEHNMLNMRVDDPVKVVTDMFDHLPPEAQALRSYRSRLLGHVYAGLALRNYRFGDIVAAKHQLAEAVAAYPSMLEQKDDFAKLLSHYAQRLPVDEPFLYIDTVLQNLPASAQPLGRVRSHVISDVNIGCAFQDFFAGRRQLAARRVLKALRYRPSWATNRGVVSILLRSLLGLSSRRPSLR